MGQQAALVMVTPAAHTGTCSGLYGLVQLLTGAAAAVLLPLGISVLAPLAVGLTVLLMLATVADRALVHTPA